MKIGLAILICFTTTFLYGQKFNITNIPDSMLKNADVVKRYEEMILEIKSPSKYTWRERHVYTVLNEKADNIANYKTWYDKFKTIDYVSATLYNQNGKELKSMKKKDMRDFGYEDGYSLMQDERYISNNFYNRTYPYTVDYEEDDTEDGVLNFSYWRPVEYDMSVEYSRYVIIAPKDYEVRYKELHFSRPPIVKETNDKKTYTWELKDFPAQVTEDLATFENGKLPYMMLAPSDFEADGYSGNMSSWGNCGAFLYQLKKGRDVLPDDTKKQVHALTDNLKEPHQKIEALYHFLQNNTHYISIQLGIGGLQPFDASYVANKKYGDCKALSNYMVSLLKEAGITGKYVVIRAGSDAPPIVTDFADVGQFDHVICCVPLQKDTVWLECTSQTLPAGYLGGFTSDRWGLLIDETGGKLVRTPKYNYSDNVQLRKIMASLSDDGNISGNIKTTYKAMQQDELSSWLSAYPIDKIKEHLKSTIALPTFDIANLSYTEHKEILPSIDEAMDLTVSNYAQVTGKRLFINPDILNRSTDQLIEDDNRTSGIELNDEKIDIDSIEITIPAGYNVESPFHDVSIDSKFGKFTATSKVTPGKIIYYRRREFYSGKFPPEEYINLVNYFDIIYKSDHSRIVLVRQG
jgi:transglutaminase-like putative cysteine protease